MAFAAGGALAQERSNSLAVNGALTDDAGPWYFAAQGDAATAFARAVPLANALGLNVTWDPGARTLTFTGNGIFAVIPTTTNIADGLRVRAEAYRAGGTPVSSPLGIVVNGVSYVAIEPLAAAFGFDVAWHAGPRLMTVDSPAPPAAPATATSTPATNGPIDVGPGPRLAAFRAAAHDDYTRIAIDLGSVETFTVAVSGNTFAVSFDAGSAPDTAWRVNDRFVQSAYYAVLDGKPALVVNTHHALGTDGSGFRTGMTDSGTFYIDFAPQLQGRPQPALASTLVAAVAEAQPVAGTDSTAPVPQPMIAGPASGVRRVVVLDPGHGGVDPGAVGYVVEHEVVLAVAMRVRALLEAEGIEIIMTREANNHLHATKNTDLRMRSDFATPDRNIFVSIHANAAHSAAATGIETWIFGRPLSQANLDRAILENGGQALTDVALEIANDPAAMILRETQLNYSRALAESVQRHMVSVTGARDRGVQESAFYVLSNARTPSILIEIGFVSNAEEGPRLGTAEYQDRLARAIAAGIMEFMNGGGGVANR